MLVSGADELLGKIVPLVQAIESFDSSPFTVPGDEGCVDNRRLFEHELLGGRTAPGLGGGLLVDPLEEWRPEVALVVVSGRRTVAEPGRDPLFNGLVSRPQILKP